MIFWPTSAPADFKSDQKQPYQPLILVLLVAASTRHILQALPPAPASKLRRAIHRFKWANSVTICEAFLANPRKRSLVTELSFDHADRMPNLRSHLNLDLLDIARCFVQNTALAMRLGGAAPNRDLPDNLPPGMFFPLLAPGIIGIGAHHAFLVVQQFLYPGDAHDILTDRLHGLLAQNPLQFASLREGIGQLGSRYHRFTGTDHREASILVELAPMGQLTGVDTVAPGHHRDALTPRQFRVQNRV